MLAGKGKITLVNNAVNMGFIRTMNRAMALSPGRDVVWLNADTRVQGNWLDRLRNIAHSSADIASVTPFTNNGELMSFPQSQVSHAMPNAREQAALDELAKHANISPVEIETGCGFCLYIKRAALNQVGYLDEVYLARGYGEETDWCLRARSFGWRHMGAPNVFVAHQGGISFGAEKHCASHTTTLSCAAAIQALRHAIVRFACGTRSKLPGTRYSAPDWPASHNRAMNKSLAMADGGR